MQESDSDLIDRNNILDSETSDQSNEFEDCEIMTYYDKEYSQIITVTGHLKIFSRGDICWTMSILGGVSQMTTKSRLGEGGGSKMAKNLQTSYMDGPLVEGKMQAGTSHLSEKFSFD